QDIEVTDRIGSGDAYLSGFFYGLKEGGAADAMACGNAAGALKNTIAGDMLLTDAAELRTMMEMHRMQGEEPEMVR
ncbi:MAG: sugar kinase, partial [Lachnospiraceae bacterium]|nr:sugar kinase [Lachnospiraceae bacterium]